MGIKLFGIKNCDTMKKAMRWLKENDISFEFHDYKREGIDQERIKSWCAHVSWETLLNTRGTTWRKLGEDERLNINKTKACALMHTHPSLIKRPVLINNQGRLHVGFSDAEYEQIEFQHQS